MKFTLSWLKDHLDTSASVKQIADTLTMIGLEVEHVSDPAESLKAFTVAKILSAEKHPQADKLQVCKVESDVGELQIVCGAANARAGLFVVLAKEGAVIPGNGMVIKKTKIRGIESNGMLCSAEELAIEGDSEGIIELPESKIGAQVSDVMGLNDSVFEINVTPNRADALSVYGVARDLAAAGLGSLKKLGLEPVKSTFKSLITVSLEDSKACPLFIGATIKGVKNGVSPEWMQKRLAAIGQKPISALVDITNYLTIDLARPLHVFDAKKLKGNIVARAAKAGEKLKALNGKEYTLEQGMTVIADDSGALGLGGIIGGEPSSCDANTTDVFLEVAYFDPITVAKTGRKLQIDSDARYRFERGVDPGFVEDGAKLAISLIQKLCGGEASELVIAGKAPEWKRTIAFDAKRVETLGGISIPKDKAEAILKALGFTIEGSNAVPPSWRGDVEGPADLVEEVLRIHGYDNIPNTPLPKLSDIGTPLLNTSQKRTQVAKRSLAARGFLECCTWSFLPTAQAKMFGGGDDKLKLQNPISADLDCMRPCLIPNLLDAARRNGDRGAFDLNLFEVGLQFHDVTPEGQKLVAAGLRVGSVKTYKYFNDLILKNNTGGTLIIHNNDDHLEQVLQNIGIFDVKADALALLQSLGAPNGDVTTQVPAWYHPGRSGALTLGKNVLGYFGELHPAIVKAFDIEHAAAFEIFLEALPVSRGKKGALKVSNFQAVERDFAFTVDDKVTAADITKAIAKADKLLITEVVLFDVYSGKGIDAGKKSVAVKVTLQATDRTFSDADIDTVSKAVIEAAKSFGGQLRQ